MKIIGIHSYKGGSGKTLISSNLSTIFAKQGYRVLLIESDFSMPSLLEIFQIDGIDVYLNDYLGNKSTKLKTSIYHTEQENLDIIYCNPDFSTKDPVFSTEISWFNKNRVRLQRDLLQLDYEYIIFDMAPGIHLFTINMLSISTDILLILRPDNHSINGTMNMLDNIYSRTVGKTGSNLALVINQIPDYEPMTKLLSDWETGFKFKYDYILDLFEIPYASITAFFSFVRKTVLPKDDPTQQLLLELASRIIQWSS